MKILVLAADNPFPPISGSKTRNFYLWQEVRRLGHEVRILSITRNEADIASSNDLIEFFTFTKRHFFRRAWGRLFYSYHQWPVSETLKARVKELQFSWQPDIIHAEELRMGFYFPETGKTSLCVHNVESDLLSQMQVMPFKFAPSFLHRIYLWNLRRFERRVFKRASYLFAYSELDRKRYAELYPEFKWSFTSNGCPELKLNEAALELPAPENILFVGSLSYSPNIEGLFWFLDHVYPELRDKISLTVAGSTPGTRLKEKLASLSVRLLDTPADLEPVYASNSMLIVPILKGSGTRGKILEALMFNRVVLTTSKGVEGLELNSGEGIIKADSVEDFRKAILTWLSSNNSDRMSMAMKGREKVCQLYTWRRVAEKLLIDWVR